MDDSQTGLGFYYPHMDQWARERGTHFVLLNDSPEISVRRDIVVRSIEASGVATEGLKEGKLHLTLADAVSATLRSPDQVAYVTSSSNSSEGFAISSPDRPILADLVFEELMGDFAITEPDRISLACGIARGAFRLLSTSWLDIRTLWIRSFDWCQSGENAWTILLTRRMPSHVDRNTYIVEKCYPHILDIISHEQIFSIGMILVRLVLNTSSLLIDEAESGMIRIYKYEISPDAETNAAGIAADVEAETNNILLGNIVFFCLSVLLDEAFLEMSGLALQKRYYEEVVMVACELQEMIEQDGRGAEDEDTTGTEPESEELEQPRLERQKSVKHDVNELEQGDNDNRAHIENMITALQVVYDTSE